MTLARIAWSLRYFNTTDEEDAMIPRPWNHQNIPQPVKITSRKITDPPYKPHTLVMEEFADGSVAGRSESFDWSLEDESESNA